MQNQTIQEQTIPENVSKRITALRFLLAVFVVFIHNCYTAQSVKAVLMPNGEPPAFVQNEFGRWVQLFITEGLARAAVPLFFMFAAYLQAKKNDSYPTLLKKKSKSLLLPFALWTFIYVFYYAGLKVIVLKIAPQLLDHPENTCLSWTAIDWFHKLIGYTPDGNGGIVHQPAIAHHLWFVRDLFILSALSPLLKFLIKKFPAAIFVFALASFLAPFNVYFVEPQALFFYVAGLCWGMFEIPLFEKIDQIKWKELVPLFAFLFVASKTFCQSCGGLAALCSCAIFLKISAQIIQRPALFERASYFAGFSFFLYAAHTPVLSNVLAEKFWLRLFPMTNTFFSLFEYFGVSILSVVIATAAGIALKKICPPLFRALNGGRN